MVFNNLYPHLKHARVHYKYRYVFITHKLTVAEMQDGECMQIVPLVFTQVALEIIMANNVKM
jgi:hypothetical protein